MLAYCKIVLIINENSRTVRLNAATYVSHNFNGSLNEPPNKLINNL